MSKVLLIDNYDSFTYNVAQVFLEFNVSVHVKKNDDALLKSDLLLQFQAIIISPGPGRPEEAGYCEHIISKYYKTLPILGICLGHQAIGEVFGAKLEFAPKIMHGKTSRVYHDGHTLFSNVIDPFPAMRYHSLILEKENLPPCLKVSAWTEEGEVMGIRHTTYPVEGVQFHPESILTKEGRKIIKNFLVINNLLSQP